MSDTHVALEASDGLRVKDITDHAIGLDLVETATRTAGDDTSCILATKDVSGKSQGAAGPSEIPDLTKLTGAGEEKDPQRCEH